MKRYKALVGLNYKVPGHVGEKRVEPGEVVDDIPAKSVPWLLAQGCIEEHEGSDD